MAIDWDKMPKKKAQEARKIVPVIGYQRIVYGPDDSEPKPKRKQQGRGENQLELAFGERLNIAKLHCQIVEYWLKPFVLKIGPATTFEPDFMVFDYLHRHWIIDTKGPHSWEDSRIKIKIAAEKCPQWRWLIVTRPEGVWRAKEVTAAKGIGRKFIDLPWLS